jgi:lipopolysaccharide export system protein LptA
MESNSGATLKEGWEITGATLHSLAESPGSPPQLLRAIGTPARAKVIQEGQPIEVQAAEIHYRQDTGLLVFKGMPSVKVGLKKLTAANARTIIILNLAEGTFHVEGPTKISQ